MFLTTSACSCLVFNPDIRVFERSVTVDGFYTGSQLWQTKTALIYIFGFHSDEIRNVKLTDVMVPKAKQLAETSVFIERINHTFLKESND